MAEIRVEDEKGTVHVFPDGSTPDMIAKAMNVKPPASSATTEKKPGYFTPENFQNLASEAAWREQQYQYRSVGPESQGKSFPARAGAGVMSGVEGITRVVDQITAGLMDPKTAAAFVVSKFSPALAGAYFMTQSSVGAKDAGKDILKNGLTPDNAERALLSLSGIAGGASMAETFKPGAPKPAGELLKGVKERAQGVARRVTESKAGATKAVVDAGDKYAEDLGKNQQARREAIAENIDKDAKAKADIERGEKETAEKNRAIESENAASRGAVALKQRLATRVDEQSAALGRTIKDVESKVYAEADSKFNAVRAQIGDVEAPPDSLIESVKSVEKNILQDIPENIKEFRSILQLEGDTELPPLFIDNAQINPGEPGYEGVRQAYSEEGLPTGDNPSTPLTWDKLQSLKSRLDARLRSRARINGDLKRGLFSVRDSIVDEMGKMADDNGAGELWSDARDFWRQMREDFHEPTGPSGSGSPVAQALDAVDPKNIRQPFLNKQSGVGNRAIDILRKYPQFGGTEAATQAEQLVRDYNQMQELPKKATETPTKEAPKHKIFGFKEVPEQPAPPTVNPDQVSRERIQETAQRVGRLNVWDARIVASSVLAGLLAPFIGVKGGMELGAAYVVTKYLMSNALDKPKIVNWIATTPPAELTALRNLPQAKLVNIKGAITAAGELTKPKTISPELREFLGPENVKKILAAAGAAADKRERKPPGVQKRELQRMRSSNPNMPTGEEP